MNFLEYQIAADKFRNPYLSYRDNLTMSTIGISSESGEVAEEIKHYLIHGHIFDVQNLKKELGDLLWYINAMCTTLDISLEEIAAMNIVKLTKRYPNGFNHEDSINRKE
jgi:NTP pyrophosphatase (non-canonical NTP hydrolase)